MRAFIGLRVRVIESDGGFRVIEGDGGFIFGGNVLGVCFSALVLGWRRPPSVLVLALVLLAEASFSLGVGPSFGGYPSFARMR